MTAREIETLREDIARAEAELDASVRRLAGKRTGGEMEAYEAAFQQLLNAERKLATAEARPHAVAETMSLLWDVGAPLPTLIQSDNDAHLLFLLSDDESAVGLVRFDGCSATLFGNPGDETFPGHPLHGSGFEPYRAMRVINSPWIDQLRRIDSVHPRHNEASFAELNHFIFPFHDTTFECVARSYAASRVPGRLSDAVKAVVDQLF
ncbi:hypothetical protein [Sphingosinicella sp. BN140058]|uniref:hypothetical protein n=1 Tax=Sphingosinicella sp. BN140058 TaxID=1892855 RepID=UPI001010C813|nr:hypothetical protein [Sphingosinicella sp. BN140058]QAY75615.1 hypothetical protein ETR14_03030 [Sphingosinicella sp. BN140058]